MKVEQIFTSEFTDEEWEKYFTYLGEVLHLLNPDVPLSPQEPCEKYKISPEPDLDISWLLAYDGDDVSVRGAQTRDVYELRTRC